MVSPELAAHDAKATWYDLYTVVSADDALGEALPLPRGEGTLMELCGDDEALARRARAEPRRWLTHTEDAHDPQG